MTYNTVAMFTKDLRNFVERNAVAVEVMAGNYSKFSGKIVVSNLLPYDEVSVKDTETFTALGESHYATKEMKRFLELVDMYHVKLITEHDELLAKYDKLVEKIGYDPNDETDEDS